MSKMAKSKFSILFSLLLFQVFLVKASDDWSVLNKTFDKVVRAHPDSALQINHQILQLAEGEQNDSLISYAYLNYAVALQRLELLDSAKYYLEKAISITKEGSSARATVYKNYGNFSLRINDYSEGINYYLKGLKIAESKNDTISIAKFNNNIGSGYRRVNEIDKALEHYKKSFEFGKKDTMVLLSSYINISNLSCIYKDSISDEDIAFLLDGIQFCEYFPNANAYKTRLYLAASYCFKKNEEIQKALLYADSSEATLPKRKISSKIEILGQRSNLYYHLGDVQAAIKNLEVAEDLASEYSYSKKLLSIQESLYSYYETIGETRIAFDKLLEYQVLKDSLYDIDKINEISKLQTQYETEKKENQIVILNTQNELQTTKIKNGKKLRIALIGILAAILALAFVLFRTNRFKTKTNQILAKQKNELETLNATKDKLFAIIAHDLKNPLSAFRNLTGHLENKMHELSKDEIHSVIEKIHHSSTKLSDLLQNLLQWALSQTGNFKEDKLLQYLRPYINETTDLLETNAQEKNIALKVNLEGKVKAYFDDNLLLTVLRNLVSNAIKFTDEQGEITILAFNKNDKAYIEISDNGIGMSADDCARLFNIHEDISSIGSSPNKGTGLGLILCKELVERMNGNISVSSELKKGTTFRIELPATNNEE